MATFSGTLPEYSVKTSNGITWNITVSYVVTPSDNLDNYSISLTLAAKRGSSGTSYNEEGSSYVYYMVNGVKSDNRTVRWTIAGGNATATNIDTYTIDVSSNDVDFSNGIPIEVYWHTGVTSGYCPSSVTVSGTIEIPEEYAGLVYIDNGESFDAYLVYIDNGTSIDRYIPYIDNGTSWDLCS